MAWQKKKWNVTKWCSFIVLVATFLNFSFDSAAIFHMLNFASGSNAMISMELLRVIKLSTFIRICRIGAMRVFGKVVSKGKKWKKWKKPQPLKTKSWRSFCFTQWQRNKKVGGRPCSLKFKKKACFWGKREKGEGMRWVFVFNCFSHLFQWGRRKSVWFLSDKNGRGKSLKTSVLFQWPKSKTKWKVQFKSKQN